MDRKKRIAVLIKANAGWGEGDTEFLAGVDDVQFDKIEGQAQGLIKGNERITSLEATVNELKTNALRKPGTVDEFIAGAPLQMQEVLRDGIRANNEQRTSLVEVIKANARNPFTDEELAKKGMTELHALASLAGGADFSLQGGSTPKANADAQPGDAPVLKWDAPTR
jgi:hypothetical protein